MLAGWAAGPCFTPIEKWERAQKCPFSFFQPTVRHFSTVPDKGREQRYLRFALSKAVTIYWCVEVCSATGRAA